VPGGGPNRGDLFIRLKQDPNSVFTVKGNDTEVEVKISRGRLRSVLRSRFLRSTAAPISACHLA
jgi:hypothetical protein